MHIRKSTSVESLRTEARKWFTAAAALGADNAKLREQIALHQKQAATQHNEALVARASELILSRKLFNSLIQLTDVHCAVGRQRDYPQQYPRAVALDNNFPHAPLDSDQLSQQCYHRIRFSLESETYTAAEETTVETESTSPAHLQ
eukprot:COSAG01_NODE_3848_length_5639_cov_59.210251_5_plen_146_part_00